jgi:hypothetical protein
MLSIDNLAKDNDILSTGTNFTVQTSTDSTTGFQVLDSDGGTPTLNIDTVSGIGNITIGAYTEV